MKFACHTLFDITATGVTGTHKTSQVADAAQWNRSRNQQRNWETITQLIGMRTQLYRVTTPVRHSNQWQFEFEVETPAVFGSADNPVALLKNDAIGVPMLTDLDNEPGLDTRLIPDHNIWFQAV